MPPLAPPRAHTHPPICLPRSSSFLSLGAPPGTRREPLHIADTASFPLSAFAIPPQYVQHLSHVLIPNGLLLDRVEKLAADIREDYPGKTPHLLVVLKGGSEFATDLTRILRRWHTYSGSTTLPFTVDYIRVKSYEGTSSTGTVTVSGIDLKTLEGRDVILLEDIIDTGTTMAKLLPFLLSGEKPPASVRVAALLEKRTHKSCGFLAHYVGFSIPDAFVVGYNLDFNEAYRDMTHLCVRAGNGGRRGLERESAAVDASPPTPPLPHQVINPSGIEYFKAHSMLRALL